MDRLYRVSDGGQPFYAVEHDGHFRHATFEGGRFGARYTPGDAIAGGLHAVRVLAPVRPSKMVCVGQNYLDHVKELGRPVPTEPVLFLKPPTTVIDPEAPIKLPPGVGRVDHEAELAVVIGRPAHRVPRAKAWDYIFGITAVNDVTARDIQNREVQYTRAKGFDTFAPIGPSILVGVDGHPRSVEGFINGEKRQSSTTAQLIFPIDLLVEYITFVMTLEPGDIVFTGTPSGVGPLKAGDQVTVRVEGVGDLTNPVENE
jgi:2-keto-4-pentenoate hydratase/2-oxohepta-3-ene-1,7-dioic acid hydratase in catechol pathway